MKKRMISLLLLIVLIFSLTACAKVVSTDFTSVEVTVTDSYHRNMWVQTIPVGKTRSVITHPAIYRIRVVYNGVEYAINDRYTYETYKDKIGETVTGVLKTSTYDDGTIRLDIVSLE